MLSDAFVTAFLDGLKITSILALATGIASFAWGGILFFLQMMCGRPGRVFVEVYVAIFRNIPVLIPIFVIFFGFPLIGLIWPAAVCGVVAISLQQGGYITEILRGNANAIDRTQHDAALALGVPRTVHFRKLILPQVLVYSLPALGSQAVLLMKDTSLLSAIAVVDIMLVARMQVESTGDAYTPFLAAAVMYLFLTLIIDVGFSLTRRFVKWA